MPPRIVRVIPTFVPQVNADGNETSGVPSVLHQAPLGTYLGWNITASGFFEGQGCGFTGGYVPFAKTRGRARANGDPRLSVEERYGTLEGYVCVVERAAEQAVARAVPAARTMPDRLIDEAEESGVLPPGSASSPEAVATAIRVCRARECAMSRRGAHRCVRRGRRHCATAVRRRTRAGAVGSTLRATCGAHDCRT